MGSEPTEALLDGSMGSVETVGDDEEG